MSVARITEISATFKRALKTRDAQRLVKEPEVQTDNGKISAYKVILKITFVLDES